MEKGVLDYATFNRIYNSFDTLLLTLADTKSIPTPRPYSRALVDEYLPYPISTNPDSPQAIAGNLMKMFKGVAVEAARSLYDAGQRKEVGLASSIRHSQLAKVGALATLSGAMIVWANDIILRRKDPPRPFQAFFLERCDDKGRGNGFVWRLSSKPICCKQ